jgi:microcystin-dependent protein
MNATLGEIKILAAPIEPRGWAFCDGKELLIAQNPALYSVIGTTYGGDAKKKTFKLPDLRNRAAIGTMKADGQPSTWNAGKTAGVEVVSITEEQMPNHIHVPSVQSGGSGTTTIYLMAATRDGDKDDPAGNILAEDNNNELELYAPPVHSISLTNLHQDSIKITNVTGPKLTGVTFDNWGTGTSAHNNLQPSLALNYIICIDGEVPLRPDL